MKSSPEKKAIFRGGGFFSFFIGWGKEGLTRERNISVAQVMMQDFRWATLAIAHKPDFSGAFTVIFLILLAYSRTSTRNSALALRKSQILPVSSFDRRLHGEISSWLLGLRYYSGIKDCNRNTQVHRRIKSYKKNGCLERVRVLMRVQFHGT